MGSWEKSNDVVLKPGYLYEKEIDNQNHSNQKPQTSTILIHVFLKKPVYRQLDRLKFEKLLELQGKS